MSRTKRSQEELSEAAELVGYEFEQLVFSMLAQSNKVLFGNPINNATIESFLIHYRNLRGFLYPSERDCENPDNVLAVDFLDSWSNRFANWQEVADLESERLNRALAHISYSRIAYKAQDKANWPAGKMVEKMISEMKHFIAKLPGPSRQDFIRVVACLQMVRTTANDH